MLQDYLKFSIMSSIFISHSSKDNKAAKSLREKLLEKGHKGIFLDFDPADGILAGKNWEHELYAQLRSCQAIIVLCTEHSMKSPWCFAEITLARALGKAIFPIKIADCEIVGLLSEVQVIDYNSLGEEETYVRLWRGLKEAGLDPKDAFDWDNSRPPYPGLLAFEAEDAAIYFGRDNDIREGLGLLNRLRTFGGTRLTLVLGASGSGKSSLVKAGILPRLKKNKQKWIVLDPFRRQKDPFAELANVIEKGFQDCEEAEVGATYGNKWLGKAEVEAKVENLMATFNTLRTILKQEQATVLLTIDQFEEFLGDSPENQSSEFLALLQALLKHSDASVMVLATLRSDFLGTFQTHPILQNLDFEDLTVNPLGHEAIAQVIQKPADVAGVELGTGLVELVVNETKSGNALPLLAFTLRELWENYGDDQKLEIEEYLKLGGLEGSIRQAAQTILDGYCSCSNSKRSAVEKDLRRAFLKLVRIDEEGKAVRQQARWQDLSSSVYPLLEKFVQGRLLKSSGDDHNRLLEVSHETIFTAWPLLENWIEESRDQLRQKQKIEAAAQEWRVNKKSKGYLLQGRQLTDAKIFQQKHGKTFALSTLAEDFIRESFRQTRINRLKVASLTMIPIIAIAIPVEGYLRQESIRKNLEIYQTSRKAYIELTKGCLDQEKHSWMPKYFADRLFGNCESFPINHPPQQGSRGNRQFESQYYLACGTVNSTSPKAIPGILLSGGAEAETISEDAATQWFLKQANGGDYLVLRYRIIGEQAEWICQEYEDLVNSAAELTISSLEAASNRQFIRRILDAEALFIAAGDQDAYEGYWIGTPVAQAVNYLINQKKVPVAGTSDGMAILGDYYYAPSRQGLLSSEILNNPFHHNTKDIYLSDFIKVPSLRRVITDTHLDRMFSHNSETRYGRIFGLIARVVHDNDNRLPVYGIGLEEGAFVAIDENGIAKVFGNGVAEGQDAYFLQTNGTIPEQIKPDLPLIWNNNGKAVKVYKIAGTPEGSGQFDLNDWSTASGGSWEYWFTTGGYSGFKQSKER